MKQGNKNSESVLPLMKQKKCPACNADFSCTNTEIDGSCWCESFPSIFPLNPEADCLCPSCLKAETIKKINEYTETLSPEEALNNKAQLLPKTANTIEGIDYYTENGYLVFTKWFLLKRGYCCGNGCRHCPYGNSPSTQ